MAAMDNSQALRGRLKLDEMMSKHTSWRVGGPVDHYYEPADMEDLANYFIQLPEGEPVTVIGLGSNLLVRDGGIRGSVICLTGLLNEFGIQTVDKEHSLRVEAGMPCAIVAKRCAKEGYAGLEFLAGIPGTVGGALAMNAGAFGGETWSHVEKVEVLDRRGHWYERDKEQYLIGYRSVIGPMDGLDEEWFLAAYFKLQKDNEAEGAGLARIKELLAERSDTQPMGLPSCGSVFRNPEGDHAARLIESCELKGKQIGNAQVSKKHANFIINTGNAKATDIEQLIYLVADTVKEKTGVQLESEVRIVGDE